MESLHPPWLLQLWKVSDQQVSVALKFWHEKLSNNHSCILFILASVAPVLQPGWFPFRPTSVQKLVFPDTSSPAMETIINLREFEQLVLACRMDGRPKVEITWRINDRRLNEVLTRGGYEVLEPVQGRSVLILDLLNTFNETFDNPLLGLNTIDCIGGNLAGSANGQANLQGES